MNVIHKLTVDLLARGVAETVCAVQCDANTRAVAVTLTAGGVAWEPPAGVKASVAFKKPDGKKGWYDTLPDGSPACSVSGNVVTAILAPEVLTAAGKVDALIVFQDENLNQLATFGFSVQVEPNPAAGRGISNDYYAYSTMKAVNEALEDICIGFDGTTYESAGEAVRAQTSHQVKYSPQSLTDAQKAVARANIAAAPENSKQIYGEKISLTDASACPLQGLNIYGKTTQAGTPTPDSIVPFENVGVSKVTVCDKNLIPLPYMDTDKTQNGVTFAVQDDGGVKITGTATDTTFFNLCKVRFADITLNPVGVATDGNVVISGSGGGAHVMYSAANELTYIYVNANTTVDTVVYPQVENGTVATQYDRSYLTSINISLAGGLPGVPVVTGGNYTDSNGQKWICDEIDFARNVYVKRIHTADFSTGDWTISAEEYCKDENGNNIPGKYSLRFYAHKNPHMPMPHSVIENRNGGFCNAFTYSNKPTAGNGVDLQVCAYSAGDIGYIAFRYDACGNNGDAFVNLLKEKQVKVQYIMAQPEEIPLDSVLGQGQIGAYYNTQLRYPFSLIENDAGAWMKVSYIPIATFVKYTEQTLTDAQKERARKNIGAISIEDIPDFELPTEQKFDPVPYNLPILYLDGDISLMSKDNAVTLDYRYNGASGTCTLKWQGSSSLAYPKKNYTIKFDTAFEAQEGWGEQKKYCLKANYIDFTHARNVVSAKLWGQIVAGRATPNATLAACPNYGAVDGFPICIVLNGEYIGVYTFNIPKDGWMMNMGNGERECILCADAHSASNKFKAEATLNGDFDVEYISDENNVAWATASVNNLIRACIASDGTDLDAIGTMLDWESAIDYYILVILLCGGDMTDKNYLLSTYDGVKWFFGAYDMDSTYGLHWNGQSFLKADFPLTFSGYGQTHKAMELIWKYKKAELKARYNELRATVMSEENVENEMLNFCAQIPKAMLNEDCRIWAGIPSTSVNTVDQILNWYRMRCAKVDKEIEQL